MGVFGQPQPGHLHRIECVRFLQSKRAHRCEDALTVPEEDFFPGRLVPISGSAQQIRDARCGASVGVAGVSSCHRHRSPL